MINISIAKSVVQDGADYLKEIYTAGKDQDKTIVSVNFSKNDEIQFRFLRAVADKLVGNLPLLNTEGRQHKIKTFSFSECTVPIVLNKLFVDVFQVR